MKPIFQRLRRRVKLSHNNDESKKLMKTPNSKSFDSERTKSKYYRVYEIALCQDAANIEIFGYNVEPMCSNPTVFYGDRTSTITQCLNDKFSSFSFSDATKVVPISENDLCNLLLNQEYYVNELASALQTNNFNAINQGVEYINKHDVRILPSG